MVLEGWQSVEPMVWLSEVRQGRSGDVEAKWPELEEELERLGSERGLVLFSKRGESHRVWTREAILRLRAGVSLSDLPKGAIEEVFGRVAWLERAWWVRLVGDSLEALRGVTGLIDFHEGVEFIEVLGHAPVYGDRSRDRREFDEFETLQDVDPPAIHTSGCATGVDTEYQDQWQETSLEDLWKEAGGRPCGNGIFAAVIDAGFDPGHRQLADAVEKDLCASVGGTYPGICTGIADLASSRPSDTWHGTVCAALIGARAVPKQPYSTLGAAPGSRLGLVRLRYSTLSCPFDLAQALSWATWPGFLGTRRSGLAQVVSLSLSVGHGSRPMSPTLELALERCRTQSRDHGGAILVFAAPEKTTQGRDHDTWTARSTGVLSIGGWVPKGTAKVKIWGTKNLDLLAPFLRIRTIGDDKRLTSLVSGASFGTPLVAGTAVLLAGHHPGRPLGEIREALLCGATREEPHESEEFGYGRLNAMGAHGHLLDRGSAKSLTPPAKTPSDPP